MRSICRALILAAAVLVVQSELPPSPTDDAAGAVDAAMKAKIDAAVAAAAKQQPAAPTTPPEAAKSAQAHKRPRREPKEFFRRYNAEEVNDYQKVARRHIIVFSPPDKLDDNERLMLEAAEPILNPPAVDLGEHGGNAGGGKILFLLVDMSDPDNAPLLHRCSVPTKTSKSGVLRIAQFPSKTPLEIFKPVGKYKVSAKYIQKFLTEVRSDGPKATRALMTEAKVKDFGSIDTSPTVLRAIGSTANFIVKRPDDVVLFSYLPSCVHCKEFNETFLAVAQECEAIGCGVKFVLFDASQNEHALIDPPSSQFPQVHMFKAHEKSFPIQFDNFANKVRFRSTRCVCCSRAQPTHANDGMPCAGKRIPALHRLDEVVQGQAGSYARRR